MPAGKGQSDEVASTVIAFGRALVQYVPRRRKQVAHDSETHPWKHVGSSSFQSPSLCIIPCDGGQRLQKFGAKMARSQIRKELLAHFKSMLYTFICFRIFLFYFPLLVFKGNYWTYFYFSRGLKQMEVFWHMSNPCCKAFGLLWVC